MSRLQLFTIALATLTLGASAQAQEAASSWTLFTPKPDPSLPPLVNQGHEVFLERCQLCHGDVAKDIGPSQGAPMPGTQALKAKYKGAKPALLEERTDLTPEIVTFYVRHGAGIMPFFRPTEVSDEDLKALSAYLTYPGHRPPAAR